MEDGDIEKISVGMAKALKRVLQEGTTTPSDWELANAPFKSEEEVKREETNRLVTYPAKQPQLEKELEGFATGTFIDQLFLDSNGEPINGIPVVGQFAVTGLPDSGKSILMEEIALKVASSGRKVLFVTSEDVWESPTPRFDLQARMMQKAKILGIAWEEIVSNLFVMDTIANSELRDWYEFVKTYRFIVQEKQIDLVIVDSVTILEEYRGALKYRLIELIRYNQVHGVTGFFVNQRAKQEWDTYEMAGGIGIAHNLDGTIIIDFGNTYHAQICQDLNLKRGRFVRIARVMGSRLCRFDRRYREIVITDDGFVQLVKEDEGSSKL